jgi:hypothetical protein
VEKGGDIMEVSILLYNILYLSQILKIKRNAFSSIIMFFVLCIGLCVCYMLCSFKTNVTSYYTVE